MSSLGERTPCVFQKIVRQTQSRERPLSRLLAVQILAQLAVDAEDAARIVAQGALASTVALALDGRGPRENAHAPIETEQRTRLSLSSGVQKKARFGGGGFGNSLYIFPVFQKTRSCAKAERRVMGSSARRGSRQSFSVQPRAAIENSTFGCLRVGEASVEALDNGECSGEPYVDLLRVRCEHSRDRTLYRRLETPHGVPETFKT